MSELRSVVLEALSQIEGVDMQEKNASSDREMLSASLIDEKEFLNAQREKLVILFKGLLSSEAQNLEEKLELTLRYLQFQLSEIDKRLKEI